MRHSDDELLNFDKDRLADWQPARADSALNGSDGDLFRSHLAIAKWLEGWTDRLAEGPRIFDGPEEREAYIAGIREVMAHLRQGDFVPGGTFYEEDFA